jgi:hypothetical protein
MILKDLNAIPKTNPGELIRLRDSIYATDLLITAIGHLNFFSWLDSKPADFETILDNFNIAGRPADVMITYFRSLGLIDKKEHTYHITDYAKEFLTNDSEWSLVPYFSTQTERPIVGKMLEVLKTDAPAGWGTKKDELDWEKAMEGDDFAEMFTAGMDSRGAYFAPGLARSFNFSVYGSVIDIAGASGIYAACIQAQHPSIKTVLLEKQPVDRIARIGLQKRGLENKIEVIGADMFKDELPGGFDIHLYSHAFHDWGIEDNRQLVRKSYRSLNRGGLILIHDAHVNREKDGPLSVAEYSVLLMFSTMGKCYSVGEMEELLLSEGFIDIEFKETIGNRSILTGRKT